MQSPRAPTRVPGPLAPGPDPYGGGLDHQEWGGMPPLDFTRCSPSTRRKFQLSYDRKSGRSGRQLVMAYASRW